MNTKNAKTQVAMIRETAIHATRFPELKYQHIGDEWRFLDNSNGSLRPIGPRYSTRLALADDIDRYAAIYGAN